MFAELLGEGSRMAFQPILHALCCIKRPVPELYHEIAASIGTCDAGAERGDLQGLVFASRLALIKTPGY